MSNFIVFSYCYKRSWKKLKWKAVTCFKVCNSWQIDAVSLHCIFHSTSFFNFPSFPPLHCVWTSDEIIFLLFSLLLCMLDCFGFSSCLSSAPYVIIVRLLIGFLTWIVSISFYTHFCLQLRELIWQFQLIFDNFL